MTLGRQKHCELLQGNTDKKETRNSPPRDAVEVEGISYAFTGCFLLETSYGGGRKGKNLIWEGDSFVLGNQGHWGNRVNRWPWILIEEEE